MISLGIENYYGEVVAVKDGDKYYLELENYSNTKRKEISKEFYEAIEKEFNI